MMHTFFATKPASESHQKTSESINSKTTPILKSQAETTETFAEQVLFWSDMPSSSDDKFETSDEEHFNQCDAQPWLPCVLPRKRQKLDVPYRLQRQQKHEQKLDKMAKAHAEIKTLLISRKTQFVAGENGLQAQRTRAIECHLRLMIKNRRSTPEAAERAAETQGFAPKWGGRQVCSWTKVWIEKRELPQSARGRHAKVKSLLDDPIVAAELWTYLRSNKWAMNPGKLAQFSKNELIPSAANKYLRQIICDEMPQGLKKYMEYELFPQIHLKVSRGISLSTARQWMHKEGFWYISYAKGLYYDGHDRPDVVEYRQKYFLPMMQKHKERLVKYIVGDVDKEVIVTPQNYIERHLVLAPHDETTSQANDGHDMGWVLDQQFPCGPGPSWKWCNLWDSGVSERWEADIRIW